MTGTAEERREAQRRTVVLLTGASSGIGEATARELGRRGYALSLVARRQGELERLARELDPSGQWVMTVPGDVTLDADRRRMVEGTVRRFGRIDALVNNAGVTISGGLWWDDPDPLRVLEVNLSAPIELTRLVLPDMRARGRGHIVNIGSVAGRVATHGMYSASKFGLRGFTQGLRRELLGSGVDVSLVSPGFIRTAFTAGARLPLAPPEVVARAVAGVLERPQAEVTVPRRYLAFPLLAALLPGLTDRVVRRVMVRRYTTQERRRPESSEM